MQKLYADTSRKFRIFGLALILIGIAGITYPFWNIDSFSKPELSALEELGKNELEAQTTTSNLPILHSSVTNVRGSREAQPQKKASNRLIIETANIDMPLFVSDNQKVLLKGGWMYSGNSRPDLGGNTVIFGHRWLYKPPVKNTFYNLDKVAIGNRFSINWDGKIYNYQVSEIKIVDPTEISVLNPTSSPQVTLITCTPLFSIKQRLVVVGKQI